MFSMKKSAILAAAIMGLSTVSAVRAAQLLDFKPVPISDGTPEVIWSGTAATQGAGAIGNGDGTLSPDAQSAGGLAVETPLAISGVAGSIITSSGSTMFFDTTLAFYLPLAASSNVFYGTAVQPLGAGSFALTATDGTLLLSGTFDNAVTGAPSSALVASIGHTAATVQAGIVTYRGGKIYDALQSVPGSSPTGSMAISMTSTGGAIGLSNFNEILPFSADATGTFSTPVVPEPASLSLLGLGAVAVISRRRR